MTLHHFHLNYKRQYNYILPSSDHSSMMHLNGLVHDILPGGGQYHKAYTHLQLVTVWCHQAILCFQFEPCHVRESVYLLQENIRTFNKYFLTWKSLWLTHTCLWTVFLMFTAFLLRCVAWNRYYLLYKIVQNSINWRLPVLRRGLDSEFILSNELLRDCPHELQWPITALHFRGSILVVWKCWCILLQSRF